MLLSCTDCGTHHHAGDTCPTCTSRSPSSRANLLGPLPRVVGATLVGALIACSSNDVYGAPPDPEDTGESMGDTGDMSDAEDIGDTEGSGDAAMEADVEADGE